MSYIPWPSQLLKAIVRRFVKKEKLGDDKFQYTLFHRLSNMIYIFLVYSIVGWVTSVADPVFMGHPDPDP